MVDENKVSNKKVKSISDNALAIILAGIIISISLLVSVSSFEINGSYIVGSSPNASIKSIICDLDNNSECATISNDNLVTLDVVHYKNHIGDKFHFHANTTMSAAEVVYMLGCTTNRTVHFLNFEILVSANPILVEFYDGPNVTTLGTLSTATHNTNRLIDTNASMNIYLGPTIADDGILLVRRAILGAQSKITGISESSAEWILPPNECFAFKITNLDGNNVDLYANFFWYEEDFE